MRKNIHVPQRGGQRTTFPDSYPLGYLVTPEAVLLKAKTDLDRNKDVCRWRQTWRGVEQGMVGTGTWTETTAAVATRKGGIKESSQTL